ncbi:MAG: ComEC/Rec2 family competence protein [Dehalococcoidia bacterium]|nr:ComEC/Rec2 family competence protein [Dehalococcoidia bacterium]
MPHALTDALRATGTTHLVVVSGQNIALVAGSLVAMPTMWLSRRRAGLLALTVLPGYVVLVGAEAPVVRAAVMAVGITIATAAGRRTPAWIFLAYAAAIMLALDPLLARDVSFQLSAAATGGVLVVAPPLSNAALARTGAGGALAALIEAGAVATGAAAAVLPVQAAAFDTLSLLQILANALVLPLYGGSLLVAAAGALLGWLAPVHIAGRFLPGAFIALVDVMARVPGATIPVQAPLAAGIAWYGLLAAALTMLRRGAPAGLSPSAPAGRLTLTAWLAVATGGLWLAVLVRDGAGAVLIDAGPADGAVVAALGRAGQGSLAALVLTHDDRDHTGGIDAITRRVGATRLLTSRDVLAPAGGSAGHIDIGDRIHLSARTTIEVLAPSVLTIPRTLASDNDRGLVLLVTIGKRRILLPADIEAAAERWLTTSGQDVRADVLVVPRHGSISSSTASFLAAVDPAVAVISVGGATPTGTPIRTSSRATRAPRSTAPTATAISRCARTACACGWPQRARVLPYRRQRVAHEQVSG